MGARALACAVAISIAAPLLAAGQDIPLLWAEFWIDLVPVSALGDPEPLPSEEAARRILEEATWVFGGMLRGFEFEYAPLDRARGIEEKFALRPLGAILRGDPRLAPGRASGNANEMRGYVEYRPDAAEAVLMESYGRAPWVRAQGIGKADLQRGWPARRAAYEDSLREAVRAHLRGIEHNKPRTAKGRVVFERPPSLAVREGAYLAQARVRIEVLELLPYVVY